MKIPLLACLYFLPLLAAGCATTASPKPPPAEKAFTPKLAKFTAPASGLSDEGKWTGSYAGAVDVYIGAEERWQQGRPISLIIQPEEEGGLRLLGHVMLTAGRRSFFIGGIPAPPGNTIAGEYTDANSLLTTQYIYALTLNGSLITGTVKTQTRRGPDKPLLPADEWRFDTERLTGFEPR